MVTERAKLVANGKGDDKSGTELLTHQLPPTAKPTVLERFVGAVAITSVLGAMAIGPLIPIVLAMMAWMGWIQLAATLTVILLVSMATAGYSPAYCRWHMRAACWFTNGVYLHVEQKALETLQHGPSLWCMHPHGTSLGFGFSLNGAVRFRANDDERLVPAKIVETISSHRLRNTNGIMAPVLFYIPLIRHLLLALGCCTPATKRGFRSLLQQGVDVGILPGGMEEVALYQHATERVYVKNRAGFIKYALQYGYTVQPAYTFGEADLYHALQAGASLRMWMQRHLGFIIPIFWGPYWKYGLPWLPRSDVAIHTVLGQPLILPRIDNPTPEDVQKYHSLYLQHLQQLFETHKVRFGYGDRQLEIL